MRLARTMSHEVPDATNRARPSRLTCAGAQVIGLLGLVLLAVACSSPSAGPGVASIGSESTTTNAPISSGPRNLQQAYEAQLAYSQCMRSHGEPSYPDPVLSARGISMSTGKLDAHSAQFVSANTTCKRLIPNGGPPSPAQIAAAVAAMLKTSKCMREHGIANFPDPVVTSHSIGILLHGLDTTSPQFQTAQRICQKLAPLGGGG
jgi:hypothetical protein